MSPIPPAARHPRDDGDTVLAIEFLRFLLPAAAASGARRLNRDFRREEQPPFRETPVVPILRDSYIFREEISFLLRAYRREENDALVERTDAGQSSK